MLGVGFWNFHEFVVGESRYRASYMGVSSLDWPHNNLIEVLTETGLIGFVPYVMTHALLFMAMWQLHHLTDSGRLVWKYYVFLFPSYWITGLTESSGYSPLNLGYVLAVTVFYKYALTEPGLTQPAEVQTPDEAFSAPGRVSWPAFIH